MQWTASLELYLTTLPLFLAATLVWAGVCAARLTTRAEVDQRATAVAVAIGVGATALLFVLIGPGYRVLADEAQLLSASLGMHRSRQAFVITEALFFEAQPDRVIAASIPHRPGLFSFLLAVLHALTGFRASQPFVLNFGVSVGVLMTVVLGGRRLVDLRFGIVAALLLACVPLYGITLSSGAFDGLNLLLVLGVWSALLRFDAAPSLLRFQWLGCLLVLAAQCRYESALLAVPPLAVVWRHRHVLRGPHAALSIAGLILLAAPVPWLRWLSPDAANVPDAGGAPFALSYLPDHALAALAFLTNWGPPAYPTAELLLPLAVAGALLLRPWRRRHLLIAACLLLPTGVILAYQLGDVRQPFAGRFALPWLAMICLLAAWAAHRAGRWGGAVLVLVCALLYLPRAAQNTHVGGLVLAHEYARNLAALRAQSPAPLVIAEESVLYAAQAWSAVHPRRLEGWQSLPEVGPAFVVQRVDAEGRARPSLPAHFELELVEAYPLLRDRGVRISRVRIAGPR